MRSWRLLLWFGLLALAALSVDEAEHYEEHHEEDHEVGEVEEQHEEHHEDDHMEDAHHEDENMEGEHYDDEHMGEVHQEDEEHSEDHGEDEPIHEAADDEEEGAGTDNDADHDEHTAGSDEEPLSSDQLKNMHAKVDENKDSKISMDELLAFSKLHRKSVATRDTDILMQEMDGNKDGKISLDEFLNVTLPEATAPDEENKEKNIEKLMKTKDLETAKFKAADENGDGQLDTTELPSVLYPEIHEKVLHHQVEHAFKMKDKDGDGELTPEEFWDSDGTEDDESVDLQSVEFAKLDVDQSGKLNLEELKHWESGGYHTQEAFETLFEVADEDGDKHISFEELDKSRGAVGLPVQSHFMEWAEHHEL